MRFLYLMLSGVLVLSVVVQGLVPTPPPPPGEIPRRDFLISGTNVAAGTLGLVLATNSKEEARAAVAQVQPPGPIGVIGANGRTGALCVAACLQRGIPVRALTRTGSWTGGPVPGGASSGLETSSNQREEPLLDVRTCDVKDPEALCISVSGCSAVIYAASASKNGGNAQQVDNVGVVAASHACRMLAAVPRYVVLSSTAVTRPESLGYKFTNILGGIMDEKLKGEIGVRQAYQQATALPSSSGAPLADLSYTIIRPGGLEEPKLNVALGPSALEISQGDVLAGIISRADLAETAVEMALCNSPNVRDATFELYYRDSAQACAGRFQPLLRNGQVPRLHGDTYLELFSGIQPDGEYNIPA